MKKTMITMMTGLALVGAANAQSLINFGTITDVNGDALGTVASGQVFDVTSILGTASPALLTVSWSGSFGGVNGTTAPYGWAGPAEAGFISYDGDPEGAISNSITIAFNQTAQWSVLGQWNVGTSLAGSGNGEAGEITSDGVWSLDFNEVTSMVGDGTNTLKYSATEVAGHTFNASFTGTTMTYNYTRQAGKGGDEFGILLKPVPEPSSTALLGLGAFGLLIRRKR